MSGGGGAAAARKVIAWSDLVTLKGEKGQSGVLVRRMPGDKLGVRRANGTMFEADLGALGVLDRSYFRPGDIVESESDPGGQIGVVTGVSGAVDLVRFDADGRRQQAAGPGGVVVVSRPLDQELRRVTPLVLGDYVVSGPWLGRVVEVSLDVDVAFDDGALCRIAAGAERKLVGEGAQAHDDEHDVLRKNGRQTNSVLYPGQRVVASAPSVFRRASRWSRGYWKPSRVRGTVARVDVAGVLVRWVASMHLGTNKALIQASAPPAWQPSLEKLALFPYPGSEASVWYVGDRCFFRTPPDPCHGAHERVTTRRSHVKRRPTTTAKTNQQQPELERPMSVADTRTTVDVLWQDGTRQCGLPSPSLLLFNRWRNDYDFFPGQHVIRPAPAGEHAAAAAAHSGVVRSLNCRDKTVCVSWFPAVEGETTTVMSAYDVACDPYANFFYGDVVVRLQRHPPQVIAKVDNGRHDLDLDLSWVGHIVDLCFEDGDGHVQVKWGDGNTSKVLPHEIAVVERQRITEMLKELGDWLYDNEDMDRKKEQEVATVAAAAQEPVAAAAITGGETDSDSDSEDNPAVTMRMTTMDQVRLAVRTLIRMAGDVFAIGLRDSASSKPRAATMEGVVEASTPMSSGGHAASTTSTTGEVKAGDDFLRFDVVQSPPDHHFIDSMKQGIPVGRKWTKRVQKEWKILENDLPDTIYVRAFEDRMDLLRVAMVGASGTPYHDGLFFFDLHLPPSYPSEPPLVNYRSFGLRVNPNLYPSGTVCLSLLNTFGGEGAELWSPEASSVLQVVVSIQGLVLTAQPYYNEPGTAEGGLHNELPYSENAYLLNLQTMVQLLRRPPAGFEAFVTGHFRRRGQRVLRACKAYQQDGCLVGTLDEEGHPPTETEGGTEKRRRPCSSPGFRLALLNVLPRLVEAFATIDAQGCKPASS